METMCSSQHTSSLQKKFIKYAIIHYISASLLLYLPISLWVVSSCVYFLHPSYSTNIMDHNGEKIFSSIRKGIFRNTMLTYSMIN